MTSVTISEVTKILVSDPVFVREYRRFFRQLDINAHISEPYYSRYVIGVCTLRDTVESLLEYWISECREPATMGRLKEVCVREDFHYIAEKLSKLGDNTIISPSKNESHGQTNPAIKYVSSERDISIVLEQTDPREVDAMKTALIKMSGPSETVARKILSILVYLDVKGVESDVLHLIMKNYCKELEQENLALALKLLTDFCLIDVDPGRKGFIQVNHLIRKQVQLDNITNGRKFQVLNEITASLMPIIRAPFQRADIINHASNIFGHMHNQLQPKSTSIDFVLEVVNRMREQNIINFLKGRVDFNSEKSAEAGNAFRDSYQSQQKLDGDKDAMMLFGENYLLALVKLGKIETAVGFIEKLLEICKGNESRKVMHERNLELLRNYMSQEGIDGSEINIEVDEESMKSFQATEDLVVDLTDKEKCRKAYEELMEKVPKSYE